MAETVTFTGMILTASPMKEFDKRVEVLTKERGRISAFARGARRLNSTLSACTVPFTFGKFTFYEGRNAYNLVSGDIETYFEEITRIMMHCVMHHILLKWYSIFQGRVLRRRRNFC